MNQTFNVYIWRFKYLSGACSVRLILMEEKNIQLYIITGFWLVTYFSSVKFYTQVTNLFQQSLV